MEHILSDLIALGTTRVYLDDLVICGTDAHMALTTMAIVLNRFRKRGMRFKFSKVQFLKHTITLLGRTVSYQKIRPCSDTISGILNFSTPTSTTALRSFLGLMNWIKPHVKNLGQTLGPLYALSGTPKKGHKLPWTWTDTQDIAFLASKRLACEAVTLAPFVPGQETISMHDASGLGAGAILAQRASPTDPWRTIAVWSQAFKGPQTRWTTTEQEEYALVMPLTQKWRHWTAGISITAFTDHQAATYLFTKDPNQISSREARWLEALGQLDVTVKYVPGHINYIADALSRHVLTPPQHLVVVDLFAGTGSALIALDRALPPDVTIWYTAVETSDTARQVLTHVIHRLRKRSTRIRIDNLWILGHDVHSIDLETYQQLTKSAASLLLAGAPCPSFSRANPSARGLKDPREGFSPIHSLIPLVTWYCIECVAFASHLTEDLATVDTWFGPHSSHEAADYGPQHRVRYIWTTIPGTLMAPDMTLSWQVCLEPGWVPAYPKQYGKYSAGLKAPTLMTSLNTHTARDALVKNAVTNEIRHMTITEREKLIGLTPGDTGPPGVQYQDRLQLTGNAHCIFFQTALYRNLAEPLRIIGSNNMIVAHTMDIDSQHIDIIMTYHKLAGHQGLSCTKYLLELAGHTFPYTVLADVLDSCHTCQLSKTKKAITSVLLQQTPRDLALAPMDTLHLDFLELGPCAHDPSYTALLNVVDVATRYCWLLPSIGKNETALSTFHLMHQITDTYGLPKRIVTDNGPQFLDTWNQLWEPHGTSCHHTAVGNPKGNGLVERLNRTVTQILMALLQDAGHRKWTLLVTDTQKAINWTPHSGTLQTPHELVFGQPPQVYIAAQHRHQQNKIRDGLDNAQHRHERNKILHDTRFLVQ